MMMNFTEAISSGFQNYVNFSGRAQRSAYWYWTLFAFIASAIALAIDALIFGVNLEGGLNIVQTIVGLALLLPSLAVSIRRLHDLDRTGWWILIALTGIGAILLIIWYVMKGTDGPNRFGPDPLDRMS
jgi:uncharacterized membrane protein YhaH (DUF805 family)